MRPNDVPSVPDDLPASPDRPSVSLPAKPDSLEVESVTERSEPRPFNYSFAAGLAVTLLIASVAVFFVHRYQMRQLSNSLLDQSARAREEGRLKDAARHLKHYVALAPDDLDSLQSLAFLLSDSASSGRERFEVLQLLEQVLRADPDNRAVRRRLAELCMQFGRQQDASVHLITLLQTTPEDASLHSLLGQCLLAQGKPAEAVASYEASIQAAPRRVADYERLAFVLHEELDRSDDAGKVMDRLIAANGQSAAAYVTRARYRQTYGQLERAMIDVERAFRLSPDEPEVLALAANLLIQQWRTDAPTSLRPEQIQTRIEQLMSPDADPRLFSAAAELQLLSGRIDLSEQRLRDGLEAHPDSIELSWRLTDVLIEQSRLDEAREQLADLKRRDAPQLLIDYIQARIQMASGEYLLASRLLEGIRTTSATYQSELKSQINLHLGRCYARIGNAEHRLEAYRRVTDLAPGSVAGRMGLASALADLGRIDDAVVHYRQVIDVDGVAVVMARLLIEQNLRKPEDQREWDEVERILDSARSGVDDAELLLLRAELAEHQDRFEAAEEMLGQAQARFPGDPAVWVARAGFQRRRGQIDEALSTLATAEKNLGSRQQLLVARINTIAALEAETAMTQLEQLAGQLTSSPSQLRIQRALASAFERVGATQRAVEIWTSIAEQSPDTLEVWLRLFELTLNEPADEQTTTYVDQMRRIEGDEGAYWRLTEARRLLSLARQGERDRLPQARKLLAEVVGRLPTSPQIPLAMAELEELEGNPETAIEHYLAAIERGEVSTRIIRRSVELLYRRQRYPEAERVLQKLRTFRRDSLPPEFRRVAAGVALRTKDYETALELARKTVEESPDSRNNLWLGQILRASGQRDAAEAAFREAIRLDPTAPEPWMSVVVLMVGDDRLDEARDLLDDVQMHVPTDKSALVLARCYELIGDQQQARRKYEQALLEQPDSPTVLWAIAEYRFRRGNAEQAEPVLRRLLDNSQPVPPDVIAAARRTLALLLAMRGGFAEFREALDLIERNLDESGNRRDDLRAKAKLLATQPIRKFQREAISVLMEVDEQVPLNVTDQLQLVHLYLAIGHWSHARNFLQGLLANHDDNVADLAFGIRSMLSHGESAGMVVQWLDRLEQLGAAPLLVTELQARLHVARNEFEAAFELLTEASGSEAGLDEVKAIAVVADDLAATLDRTGRTAEAKQFATLSEALLRRLIEQRPGEVLMLVRFLGRHWRLAEALDVCEGAWEVAPPEQVALACVNLLRTPQAAAADFTRVRNWIEAAVARTPESSELSFQLANACHLQEDYERAEELYRRTIAMAPRSVLAYNELALLLTLHEQNEAEALELIDRSIELAGPLPFLLDTRAVVCLSKGDTEEARRNLEEAIADTPTPAKFFHLAQVYLKESDRPAAEVAYRRGLAAGLHADALHPLEREQFEKIHASAGQF